MACLFLEHQGGGGSCSVMYSWETPTPEGVNSVITMQGISRYCLRTCLYTKHGDRIIGREKLPSAFFCVEIGN